MTAVPRIDHLVVACAELAQGAEWLRALIGVELQAGGRHALMGTHNRLLRLGLRCYLELIAVDPQAPAPTRARWFGLDTPAVQRRARVRPFLLTWVAACSDIALAAQRVPQLGRVIAASRGALSWQITVPDDGALQFDGALPSLIQWSGATHPCDVLEDRGCALLELSLRHPDAPTLERRLDSLGLRNAIAVEPGVGLSARLRTPAGDVELAG